MKTVLLTLGRLPKALALARACKRAGCRVLVADPFRWHLCRPSRDVDRCYRVTAPNDSRSSYLTEILEIIKRESVDLLIPVSEEALHVTDLAERLPDACSLWGTGSEKLRRLHDKGRFARYAESLGLETPETHLADTPEARALARHKSYVEKPLHSCSGIGLRIAEAGSPLLADDSSCVVQAFVPGDHISSLSIVDRGREIASVFYRGRVFAGTVAVCFERVDECSAGRGWVSRFIDQSDYHGFLAFDFIVDDSGKAKAIECNPRATSGIHFFEAEALGAALLNPAHTSTVALAAQTRFQWAYSTLTEAYAALGKPREFRRRFKEMLAARDVVWSASDPLPFLLMTPMSWEILWPAISTDATLGEATQRDIAWFGQGDVV